MCIIAASRWQTYSIASVSLQTPVALVGLIDCAESAIHIRKQQPVVHASLGPTCRCHFAPDLWGCCCAAGICLLDHHLLHEACVVLRVYLCPPFVASSRSCLRLGAAAAPAAEVSRDCAGVGSHLLSLSHVHRAVDHCPGCCIPMRAPLCVFKTTCVVLPCVGCLWMPCIQSLRLHAHALVA
jgi:hypothetical protein